jgi:hypothetical protein
MLCLVFFFFAGVKGLLFLACFVRSRIKVKWLLNCFQLCSNAVLHLPCAKMLVALCESDGECSSRVILKVVDTVEAFEQTVPSLNRFRSVLPLYAKKKKKQQIWVLSRIELRASAMCELWRRLPKTECTGGNFTCYRSLNFSPLPFFLSSTHYTSPFLCAM